MFVIKVVDFLVILGEVVAFICICWIVGTFESTLIVLLLNLPVVQIRKEPEPIGVKRKIGGEKISQRIIL